MQEFTDNLALRSQAMKDNLHTLGVGCTRLSKNGPFYLLMHDLVFLFSFQTFQIKFLKTFIINTSTGTPFDFTA